MGAPEVTAYLTHLAVQANVAASTQNQALSAILFLYRDEAMHEEDLSRGYGLVHLPHALARKYAMASREWGWQWVFPAPTRTC